MVREQTDPGVCDLLCHSPHNYLLHSGLRDGRDTAVTVDWLGGKCLTLVFSDFSAMAHAN